MMNVPRTALMQGKVVLVSGATAGIGKATATALAAMGAQLILVARDPARGAATQAEIQQRTGNNHVDLVLADLSLQHSVRALAHTIYTRYPQLDVLINNAGGQFQQRHVTEDGLEYTFALNHLSYFLLTTLLLPVLERSAPARIVNVASDAQRIGRMRWDDLQGEQHYSFNTAYTQSKLANVLFTYELARRLVGTGITVNAMHPGFVRSNFYQDAHGVFRVFRDLVIYPLLAVTPEQGADTVVYLASAPEVEGMTGMYWVKRHAVPSSKQSYDQGAAARLWQISADLTHVDAPILQSTAAPLATGT